VVLNDRVREKLEVKEDIKGKLKATENIVTTLAFLNFLKFFGSCMGILGLFFLFETSFSTNLFTAVFIIMGLFFFGSAIVWEDSLKKKVKHDQY
jgi:hypothetical protein